MQVGDLVIGKTKSSHITLKGIDGFMGVVLKTYVGWWGDTPCVRVHFPDLSETKDVPEHWLGVVCAGR